MLTIISYTFCIILIYCISNAQYHTDISRHGIATFHKLSWKSIAIFTMLFVGVNYLYTYNSDISMAGDRINYLTGYNNDISPSTGLLFVYSIGKYFNCDFNDLALLITLLSVPLVFISYKYAKDAIPLMLLFFLLTPYIINGFDNFKQTYANAFSCIFFALTTYKPSVRNDIKCICAIILACLFHQVGFILIIFYAIYRLNIRVNNIFVLVMSILLGTLFMSEIMMLIANIVGSAIPFLTDKILQYFEDGSDMGEGKLMIALKGIVYFYITAILIIHKKVLITKIYNFSFYLIVCCFTCTLFLLSYYNVWMPRMAELFFFPVMLCWARSLRFMPYKSLNIIITCFLTGFFTYRLMWMTFVNPIK